MSKETKEMHPEGQEGVDRRAFLKMVAGAAATGAAVAGVIPEIAAAQQAPSGQMSTSKPRGGHLYMQTNETRNAIIHYRWAESGKLSEVERVATGGAGSGTFKPISGEESAPNAFEGDKSVILTPDRRFLFTTNGGDNSVSSFSLDKDGRLTQLDVKPTGNPVEVFDKGKSGTAKSLAYAPSKRILYVLHSFGPDHLRLMSVDGEGKLTARPERYTASTKDKDTDRCTTMHVLSPDGKFLVVGTTFDVSPVRAGFYPSDAPILWLPQPDGKYKFIASNSPIGVGAPNPDGIVVFPVRDDGTLGAASFQDGKAASPWNIAFLNHRPDTCVIGYAVGDGCALATIDGSGKLNVGPLVKEDTSAGTPSELCWLAVSPDDRFVYAVNFGYSYITSFRIDGARLSIAKDPAAPKVPGDGKARGLNGIVISGPADIWITPDGAYVYQIYGNAAKLVGYATQRDGSLKEITKAKIPYNSPTGLAGF
jgi:6-phosphogluconolactonase (cycloisomerase 2 family)